MNVYLASQVIILSAIDYFKNTFHVAGKYISSSALLPDIMFMTVKCNYFDFLIIKSLQFLENLGSAPCMRRNQVQTVFN